MTLDEMIAAFLDDGNDIRHIGTDYEHPGAYTHTGSGRYHHGEGENPHQHDYDPEYEFAQMKHRGASEEEILKAMGLSTTEYRKLVKELKSKDMTARHEDVVKLSEMGLGATAIAKELSKRYGYEISEGTIRGDLKRIAAGEKVRVTKLEATKKILIDTLNEHTEDGKPYTFVDVGEGSEKYINVSQVLKDGAVSAIARENTDVFEHVIQVAQVNNSQQKTTVKFLVKVNDPSLTEGKSETEVKKAAAAYLHQHYDEMAPITSSVIGAAEGVPSSVRKVEYPVSISHERVMIGYSDDPVNGDDNLAKDGTMIIRPSAKDLTMTDCDTQTGVTHYAQVRIAVDDSHYCKGMAMYGREDQFPPGVDVIFYTNKTSNKSWDKVLKEFKKTKDENGNIVVDKDNPFGADLKATGQRYYYDENGEKKMSAVNVLREEGDWNEYRKSLSAQFLSKQNLAFARNQLNTSIDNAKTQFDEIAAVKNAQVRNKLLEDFAESCDAKAIDLSAAATTGQLTQVLLPCPSLKSTTYNDDGSIKEYGHVYAPNYPDGHKLAIIRYPHANICEIPVLIVNNSNPEGKTQIGRGLDAIGLPKSALDQLSGADTDGDTGTCIDVTKLEELGLHVDTTKYFDELIGFDSKAAAPMTDVTVLNKNWNARSDGTSGKTMSKRDRGLQMGRITNCISNMQKATGVTRDEMVRAMKYSMIVIDAYKHNLDWKGAEQEYGIKEIYDKYSSGDKKAIWTVSKASTQGGLETQDFKYESYTKADGTEGQKKVYINTETGEKYWSYTGREYEKLKEDPTTGKKTGTGEMVKATQKSTGMEDAWRRGEDATALVSAYNTPMEQEYAKYSNAMHDIANQARKMMVNNTETVVATAEVKAQYVNEVASLKAKLEVAQQNAPKERLAQMYAQAALKSWKANNPEDAKDSDMLKKKRTYFQNQARARTGANGSGTRVKISAKEYEAINAGAVPKNTVTDVLKRCDKNTLNKQAVPHDESAVSDFAIAMVKQWASQDPSTRISQELLAKQIDISVSTVSQIATGRYETEDA